MPSFPVHHQLQEFTQTHVLSQWCHPIISSSVIPFYSCLQSFPASGYFPMGQFFPSDSQSNGVSASASVSSMNIQDWFPWDWLGGSPCSTRESQECSPIPQFKSIYSSALSFLYNPTLTSILTAGKTTGLTRWTFVGKVMSLLFNMLSGLVIAFLPRSKHLLSMMEIRMDIVANPISWDGSFVS